MKQPFIICGGGVKTEYSTRYEQLMQDIYNQCIGRDFAHLPIIEAVMAVRDAEYQRGYNAALDAAAKLANGEGRTGSYSTSDDIAAAILALKGKP